MSYRPPRERTPATSTDFWDSILGTVVKWFLYLVGGVTGIYLMGLTAIVFVNGILAFIAGYTVSSQMMKYGLDYNLAVAGGIIAATIFAFIFYESRPAKRLFALPKLVIILCLTVVVMGIGSYTFRYYILRGDWFDPYTHQPIKYYAKDPGSKRIHIYPRPICDPFSQQQTVPVTPEIYREYFLQKEHWPQEDDSVPFGKIVNFFDTVNSELTPLVWCSKSETWGYRFYYHPGYDGKTGQELVQVDPKMADTIFKYMAAEAEEKKAAEVAATEATRAPARTSATANPEPRTAAGPANPQVVVTTTQKEPEPATKFAGDSPINEATGHAEFDISTGHLSLTINDLRKSFNLSKSAGDNSWRISRDRGSDPLFRFRCGELNYEFYKLSVSKPIWSNGYVLLIDNIYMNGNGPVGERCVEMFAK